jgi:hypothetical protein
LIVLGVLATFILDREAAKSGSMPIWRKFLGVDTVIDEAMSFGVVHFGINDSLLNTGNPIRLHVLSHSWAGDLSRISNADAFMVSGAVGYFIGLLGISFLLHSIGFSLSGKRTIGVIASALFFFQASMPEELVSMPAPRMANAISMLWFLFSVYLLIRSVEQNRNIAFICYPVLVSLVTMAKAQWGLFLLIASSPLIMAEFRKNKTATVFSLAIACMAFVTSYLLLIGAAANDHATNPNTIIEFTLVQGCSLFVFAILRTPIIHILMLGNIGINHSYRNVFLVGMACLPVVFVFNGGFLTTYLYYPIILLSTPIVATIVFEQIEISGHEFRSQIFVLLGIVLGAAGFLSYLYANYRFIDSNRSDFLSILIVDLPMLIPFLVIVALATLSYPFYKNSRLGKKRKERLNSAIRFIAVLAVAINFGVFAVQANRQDVLNYFYDSSSKVDLAVSDSMLDVGQWIRENSDPSSIVATNYFCKNSASTDLVALFPEVGDCRTRNELAWVGATSKRRMLIEAPLFVTGKDMSSDEANRYSISLNFGLTGSNAAMNELQKYHVNYFVLDKRQSVKKNWNIHEETVFSRGDFLVLKITK